MAKRTEEVYNIVRCTRKPSLAIRLARYRSVGTVQYSRQLAMQSSTTFMRHQRRPATTTTCAYVRCVLRPRCVLPHRIHAPAVEDLRVGVAQELHRGVSGCSPPAQREAEEQELQHIAKLAIALHHPISARGGSSSWCDDYHRHRKSVKRGTQHSSLRDEMLWPQDDMSDDAVVGWLLRTRGHSDHVPSRGHVNDL